MADDMKEIAKLQFDISKAEGQLETLNKAFEKFNKDNKTILNDYAKTQNKMALENLKKNNKIEVQENNTLNKIKVINAKRELEEQKTLNKITVMNEKAALSNVNIWSKISNMANTYLISRGLNDLRQAASEVVTEMADVQYRMVEIDRVLNEDSLNIDKYRDKLIQLAYDYGNSFDNVSDVTLRLAQAGFDSNETLALTEKTLLALNTAELDATQATEGMVAVMSQWNLMTGDANKVSADYARIIDEINIAADNFPTTSEDILEALKRTSSAFNLTGASIEQAIATIVAAEKASQRGGKAIGTALNSIVQQLRDTKKMATLEAMGIDVYTDSAKTEFKSVMDILEELSNKMQQLKNDGKENTKEMQELNEIFSLFRRNIASSLLGEMGEDGIYDEVLKLLGDNGEGALGYSLQENEKHLGTAKAAMEQFNAELLNLKTKIWDNGGEDVFKALITLGGELIEVISDLVEVFGSSQTTISIFVSALETIAKALETIRNTIKEVDEVISNSKFSTEFVEKIRNAYEEDGNFFAKAANTYTNTFKNMFVGMNPAIEPVLDVLGQLTSKEEEVKEETEELSEKVDEVKDKITDGSATSAINDTFSTLSSTLSNSLEQLDKYAEQYQTLNSAVNEFNTTGQITSATLQSLVSNDLLQYLDLTANKASINTNEFLQLGEAQKVQAIQALQSAASLDIQKIAMGDVENISPIAKAAIAEFGNEAVNTGNKAASSVGAIEAMAKALQDAHDAALGKLGEGVSASTFEKQSNAVIKSYKKYAEQISNLDISSPLYSKKSGSSGGGSAKQATKTFEEQSQERVKIFKKEIDDLESLEKSWVNKYKKLELFSTDDLKFITHQRINRYNEYLNQINNLQGISEKDRADLVKEYSAKRQEAELEYFDLLKQKLNDQIKQLKEANEERIQGIKDAADAQIEALNKVEDENDKIRQKEEYERKRNELIYGNQGIEYWRQRTGRDAQLALQDAEQKLKDLDEDWEEKKKDWTLEEQIEEIEKARDAQIKAIEDAQEEQIKGWQAAYQEQVRLYAETGQIIYDNSVINAGYLYNAYMDNFVNPLQFQLQNVINSLNRASTTAGEVASKVGSTRGGTTTKVVAAKATGKQTYSTPIGPTKSGKPLDFIGPSQEITPWKQLIARFHGGGKVGGSEEAVAVLRPQEAVLTPEWAAGMDKAVKLINEGKAFNNNASTNIDVQGNLINMDGVKINDRKDADYLTERIEKVFRDKFNIRK